MDQSVETRTRILQAALSLIRAKGFKGATTRAIAEEAGVNEVTVFRHFKNKEGLLKAAFEQTSYVPALSKMMKEQMTGNLEEDLLAFAKLYQQLLRENSDLIFISLKESEITQSVDQEVVNIPRQLKEAVMDYLTQMRSQGKMIDTHIEAEALTFIWMNFGYFQASNRHGDGITQLSEEEYLKNSIKVFARGLMP